MTEIKKEVPQYKKDIIDRSNVSQDDKNMFVVKEEAPVPDAPVNEKTVPTVEEPSPEPDAQPLGTQPEPAVVKEKSLEPIEGIERKYAEDGSTVLHKQSVNGQERWLTLKEMHAEAQLAKASNERFQLAAQKEREAERKLQEAQVIQNLLDTISAPQSRTSRIDDSYLDSTEEPPAPVRDPRVDKLLAEPEAANTAKARSAEEASLMNERQASAVKAFSSVDSFIKKTGLYMPADGANAAALITGLIETECGGRTDDFYKKLADPNAILEKYHQVYSEKNQVQRAPAASEPEPPVSPLASSAKVAQNVEADKLQANIDAMTKAIDSGDLNQKEYGYMVVKRKNLRRQLKQIQKGG